MQIQIKDSNNDTQTQQNFGPSCFDRALHYFLLTLRMADVIHHHSLLVTSMPKFSAFFCTKLRKREEKKVSRRSFEEQEVERRNTNEVCPRRLFDYF